MKNRIPIDLEKLVALPVTTERWADFEQLFESQGVVSGCWCMWWRMTRSDFSRTSNVEKKSCMREIISQNRVPGILGYFDGRPVAWCSVAPRDEFPSLDRSRTLGRVDEQAVRIAGIVGIAADVRTLVDNQHAQPARREPLRDHRAGEPGAYHQHVQLH